MAKNKRKKYGPLCAGQNKHTGRLKKGYRWKKGHGCPVPAKGR